MPRKKPSRIPKKYARRVSPDTKRFVKRTMDRRKKKRKDQWKRRARKVQMHWENIRASAVRWILICILLLSISVFGFLLFSPVVQIREIHVTRLSPRLDVEDVQTSLASLFNRHLFFLSSFEVAELLKDSIADIETISMGKQYPSTLNVSIELHPLVAKLRIVSPDDSNGATATGATIDYLTDQGIYVSTTAAKDTETLPEIILIDWGVRPLPGTLLIQPAFIERLNAAEVAFLRQFGQDVEQRIVYLRAQEFHLLVGGRELWFDLKSPLADQLQRYRTFLREVGIDEAQEYIDLRIANKVIYR